MADQNVVFEPTNHPERQRAHVPRPGLNHDQLGAVLARIRDSETRPAVKNSLIFTALTAARGVGVRNPNWDEFDLEANIWTVCPASTRFADCRRLVLPVHLLGCSSLTALLGCVSPVAGDVERRDANPMVIEACLAHQPMYTHNEMVRSHNFLELRRRLLQEWADYLQETLGPVISPKGM